MAKQHLRFGIVDKKGFRAATWNIAARTGNDRSEVYLSCRELGGTIHSSMHHSGNWHVAYTQDAFDERLAGIVPPDKNRFIEKWPRPPEIKPGITLANRIITPWTAVRTEIDPNAKKFIEIPNAPESKATEILILFVRSDKNLELQNCTPIGTLDLSNGETVVVVHHVIAMPEFKSFPSVTARFMKGKTKEDLKGANLKIIAFGDAPDGSRMLWDCAVETNSPS